MKRVAVGLLLGSVACFLLLGELVQVQCHADQGAVWCDVLPATLVGEDAMGLGGSVSGFLWDSRVSLDALWVARTGWAWLGGYVGTDLAGMELGASVLLEELRLAYAELAVRGSAGLVSMDWCAALLSLAPGPVMCGGSALRVSFPFATVDVTSVTEFGATIRRADETGISFGEPKTERVRFYSTDPRPSGGWLTGQTLIASVPLWEELALRVSISVARGLGKITLGLGEADDGLALLPVDVANDLTLRIQSRSVVVDAGQESGFAVTLSRDIPLVVTARSYGLSGIRWGGFAGEVIAGPVALSYTWLREAAPLVIASRMYGYRVLQESRAEEDGVDFDVQHRRALSVALGSEIRGNASPLGLRCVALYDDSGAGLLAWEQLDINTRLRPTSAVGFTAKLRIGRGGLEGLLVGAEASF